MPDNTTRFWTDQDFTQVRDVVEKQKVVLTDLQAKMGSVEAHMQRQSLLLFRILLAIMSIGGAILVGFITFILAHGVH